jgi:hypothetical protein
MVELQIRKVEGQWEGEGEGGSHTLVGLALDVVGLLVLLVKDGVLGGGGAGAEACVAVLGDVLVGFLGGGGAGALDGLGDVVCGVLGGG